MLQCSLSLSLSDLSTEMLPYLRHYLFWSISRSSKKFWTLNRKTSSANSTSQFQGGVPIWDSNALFFCIQGFLKVNIYFHSDWDCELHDLYMYKCLFSDYCNCIDCLHSCGSPARKCAVTRCQYWCIKIDGKLHTSKDIMHIHCIYKIQNQIFFWGFNLMKFYFNESKS